MILKYEQKHKAHFIHNSNPTNTTTLFKKLVPLNITDSVVKLSNHPISSKRQIRPLLRMGKSVRTEGGVQDATKNVLLGDLQQNEKHPVENATWLSFATFYWMGSLMSLAYKQGLTDSDVPNIPFKESCKRNTDLLEQLWAREISFADVNSSTRPSFARVAWLYCRKRIYITSLFYTTSIILGFLTPTILMRKVMSFAKHTGTANKYEGFIWIGALVICELGRVFFFTLTWAMSYRTAIRLKSASMGLVYRKLLRTGNLNDQMSSKLLNVVSGDCSRMYDLIVSGQVSIGGPLVMLMCSVYIWYELGWLPLIGLSVFVVSYPLQYFLAKGSGAMRRKAVRVKDERVSLISQVVQHFKFLKMFAWESYLYDTISDVREKERKYLVKGQLLQSFSIVLGPTLPHIAAILTFLLYISTGNVLVPQQAFIFIAIYAARVRPTFMRIRAGFRAWFDAKIAVARIQAFTTLFIFSLLFFSIRMFTQMFDCLYSFRICSERLKSLLILPETKDSNANSCGTNHATLDEALLLEDFSLIRHGLHENLSKHESDKGESRRKKATKNMNSIERLMTESDGDSLSFRMGPFDLQIKKGSFIGICGYVGSGKTTLLETIAGSFTPEMGMITVFGRTAYVPQHPWLFKGTIRDNITFGEPFDSVRYYSCIESCCLINDFAVLPLGDLTRVDNNGMNLSGGQRQRITLARALYYQLGDIYLLDDPLSGLDNRVAKIVFENAVNNKLRKQKKTILFVTHQLNFLKECDEILVFSDGKISERGTHQQLVETQDSIYNGLWNLSVQSSSESETEMIEDCEILDLQIDVGAVSNAKKLQLELENSRKDVSPKVYWLYIKSAGGWLALLAVLLAFGLSAGSTSFSSWWLKHWFGRKERFSHESTNSSVEKTGPLPSTVKNDTDFPFDEHISNDSPNFAFNRNVYAAAIGVIFITSLCRTIFFVMTSMRASKRLHQSILGQFFCSRMRTLEKLGSGQVFNLFSRDIDEVDGSLPSNIENFMQNVFVVLSILALVTLVFPTFLIFGLVVFVIFTFYRKVYNTAIRDLKRIESRRRSPIFNRISETMKGLGVIRAFNKEKLMTEEFEKLTDASCSVSYIFSSSVRWLSIRLDALSVLITGSVAALIYMFQGSISVAAAGLALSYAAQLSGVFQFTVRLASETEAKFVSVERMHTFLSYNQVEGPEVLGESKTIKRKDQTQDKLNDLSIHPNWPTSGHVKFDSVTLCYSSTDPPVLKEVCFEVQAGQNIGIIGRTGSGKSSIGNALFRLMELKSGSICIDGVDISTLPLNKLRNSMCVIPQDPSVFQKSIRFNLDAGKLYQDHELWTVLEKTGLKSCIENLDSQVGLSHGQKQLLCIARALLRQSKILFVDEATSNMDTETAAVVEKLIAEEFKYSTVFIVAHRTSALKNCDNILIMGDGEVRDFGPLDVLSRKPEFKQSFEKFENVALE